MKSYSEIADFTGPVTRSSACNLFDFSKLIDKVNCGVSPVGHFYAKSSNRSEHNIAFVIKRLFIHNGDLWANLSIVDTPYGSQLIKNLQNGDNIQLLLFSQDDKFDNCYIDFLKV